MTVLPKIITAVIVVILIILVIIFLTRKVPTKKSKKEKKKEDGFRFSKKVDTQKEAKYELPRVSVTSSLTTGYWSKENSRNLVLATMPSHVQSFFKGILKEFEGYNLYLGVKNYASTAPSPSKQFQWELYILPELGKLGIDLPKWYETYKKVFADNFNIEMAKGEVKEGEIPYDKIISISVDIDEETPKHAKMEKLNFYYTKQLDFPSCYMDEITFRPRTYSTPNTNTVRGRSFLGVGRGLTREQMENYLVRLGMEEPDISNLIDYVKNLNFPHSFYSISDKAGEYGLYMSPANYDVFLKFIKDHGYPSQTIEYVEKNKAKISQEFWIEIALYFKKGDPTMKPTRSAFYTTINQ